MLHEEVLKSGNVGVSGSTGSVLHQSLLGAEELIRRSLAEVRLTQGIENRVQFRVSAFIEEIATAAALAANVRGVTFTVLPLGDDAASEADRQVGAEANRGRVYARNLQGIGCVCTVELPRIQLPAVASTH